MFPNTMICGSDVHEQSECSEKFFVTFIIIIVDHENRPDDPTRDYCRAKVYSAIKFSEKYLVLPNNHAIFAPNLGI